MKNNNQDIYALLKDSYEGAGGFIDGSYLIKHAREDNEKYESRKNLSYYLNYFKPCIDAHVSPIFKTLALRDYRGAGANSWATFIEDVDFRGTKIKDLMKQAAHEAKLNGICFIVMDREQEAQPRNLAELDGDRNNIPYAYVVAPGRVNEVITDKHGRIISFEFTEQDPFNENINATRIFTVEGWTFKTSKGVLKGSWDLGCVPVIPVPSKLVEGTYNPFPASEFLSIAKTNKVIYNLCSWLNEILANQTFSILLYPSTAEDSLVIGTNNALGYPADAAHEPNFIAPPADPANILSAQITKLQEECYRMAGVVNVTGVRSEQSGVAKQWDYEQTNQVLADFADILENAEKQLANLFMRFTGVEFEYRLNYPSDFTISDTNTELSNAEIAKGLAFGDAFNLEVYKKVLTSYLPELSDEDFDRLVAEYESEQEKKKLDEEQALRNLTNNNAGNILEEVDEE